MQEVLDETDIVAWVNKRLADGILVRHGGNRWHLRNQAVRGDLAVLGLEDVETVVVEGRQGACYPAHDCHRVSVTAEAAIDGVNLLIEHRVVGNVRDEPGLLRGAR